MGRPALSQVLPLSGAQPGWDVVALGEALETQFWRGGNGRMRWLTVDLPPVLGLRRRVLPEESRQQSYSGSAPEERLPGSSFVFDVVPEKMLELVRKASGRERDQAVELWTWLFDRDERAAITEIPGVAQLRDLSPPFVFAIAPVR